MVDDISSEEDIIIDGKPKVLRDNKDLSFRKGQVVYRDIPKIYHEFEESIDGELNEAVIATGFRGPLVSSNIKEILEQLEVENLQFFPVELYHKNAKKTIEGYYIMNVIGSFDPIDYDKTDITYIDIPGGKRIGDFSSLTFIPMDDLKLPKIFRLKPYMPIMVADSSVKEAFEKNYITGFKFYKPEEYSL